MTLSDVKQKLIANFDKYNKYKSFIKDRKYKTKRYRNELG